MTKERLKYLLDRLLENQATEAELKEYADWYESAGAKGPDMLDHQALQEYSTNLYSRITDVIDEKEKQQKRTRRIIKMRWAVAASLILMAGTYFFYNTIQVSKPAGIATVKTIQPDPTKKKTANFENNDQKSRKINLDDGSVVELFPGSKLACTFSESKRELYLTGKGFFEVAKDPSKPFTVYSSSIATTALGTSFTITAYPRKNNIEVSLHTGKVVVKQVQQQGAPKMKDMYLLPGQSLLHNVITGATTLQSLNAPTADAHGKHAEFGRRTGYEAVFNQAPLTAVLDSIAKEYAVPIGYNRAALSDMYYSGHILETDSLARVLKRIALLHNLRITATAKGYSIRKEQ